MSRLLVAAALVTVLSACGNGTLDLSSRRPLGGGTNVGSDGPGYAGTDPEGNHSPLEGFAVNEAAGAGALSGWVLALIDRDTGNARTAKIDAAGAFSLTKVPQYARYALALLTPDQLVASVFAAPDPVDQHRLHPFFSMNSFKDTRIVRRGTLLSFANANQVAASADTAFDANADGLPDGVASFLSDASVADGDNDGTNDDRDPDIDGDGLVNVLDADIDGDGRPNALDEPVIMASPSNSHPPFYNVTVTTESNRDAKAWRSADYTALTFSLQIRAETKSITTVEIIAPESLVSGAVVERGDAAEPWNGTLADDGLSADGSANDGIYGRRVILQADRNPRAGQVIFFRVTRAENGQTSTLDYPFTFSLPPAAPIIAQYDLNTKTAILAGNPFGSDDQSFKWYASAYDAAGQALWISAAVKGTSRLLAIPTKALVNAVDVRLTAALPDAAPGYPTYVTHSRPLPLN